MKQLNKHPNKQTTKQSTKQFFHSAWVVNGFVRQRFKKGFTLVEVLVALTILAIALMAGLRASNGLIDQMVELDIRQEALWAADNLMQTLRPHYQWLPVGTSVQDCQSYKLVMECHVEVVATANPYLRKVTIEVMKKDSTQTGESHRYARLVTLSGLVGDTQ